MHCILSGAWAALLVYTRLDMFVSWLHVVGDYVYVKMDEDKLLITRIDKMWTGPEYVLHFLSIHLVQFDS